ncbi:MAG: hypothetical protein KIT57_11440 [Blastocatellales bacterium]|nr:hypothetical protein [Blastocatellales bacterium]
MIKALMIMRSSGDCIPPPPYLRFSRMIPVVKQLCELLNENGKFPSRRTLGKAVRQIASRSCQEMIGYFRRHLVVLLDP